MPISRKKACEQCRTAKARCSLDVVCSRCLNRGLACEYNGGRSRARPYSRPRPGEPKQHPALAHPAITTEPLSSLFSPLGPEVPPSEFGNILHEGRVLNNTAMISWDSSQVGEPQSMLWDRAAWNMADIELQPPLSRGSPYPEASSNPLLNWLPTSMLATTTAQPHADCPSSSRCESDSITDMDDDTMVAAHGHRHGRLQTLRRGTTTEQYLMTRILVGQIENYPRMLMQGSRLPPFIYPRCILNGRPCHQCTAVNGTHQCLPQPLANCAALIQMFYNRNSSNAKLVWRTIYDEQKRLQDESHTYDVPTLLAATQATVLYLIIQAQDTEYITKNNVASMAVSLADMAISLNLQTQFKIDISHNPNVSQESWAIDESTRRTVNLFYVIGIVLVIRIGSPKQTGCANIRTTPLPCGRDLWDPDATENWAIRLHRYCSRLVSNRGLVIDDLLSVFGNEPLASHDDADTLVQKDLMNWCGNMDDFGTLIWMASLLDKRAS